MSANNEIGIADIVETLESIAQILELKGENPFKVRAYTNGVRALENYSGNVLEMAREGRLSEIEGIGKALSEKVGELVLTGRMGYYEELRQEFPESLFQMFDLPGFGAKKIKAVYEKLGVDSVEKLEAACQDGSVAQLPGFGAKSATNILKSIEQVRTYEGEYLFGEVYKFAEKIRERLREHEAVSQCEIAGSFRRRKETVHDLDFLVATKDAKGVGEFFVGMPEVKSVLAHGETKCSVVMELGVQCDLRMVTQVEYPFALAYFTGSKEHNVEMRARAQKKGWTLNEYRMGQVEGKGSEVPPEIQDEAGIYAALGLDYIEPELRENLGEFQAAEKGELPRLVEWSQLKGIFHNHTRASDGLNTLQEMVEGAQELGLTYFGVADHSKSSFQANGMDEKRLLAQVQEVQELNAELKARGDDFRVFSGVECDILKNGSLDFSEEILEQLDYVVASVHSSFSLSETEMTDRFIRAMESPNVTMLGHLTGRILLRREPYKVHIERVLEAAAATGTIVELNAHPARLDLDWRWWPKARELGVKCSINPDAHEILGIQHVLFGSFIARKGWLTVGDVINTQSIQEVTKTLARKRI